MSDPLSAHCARVLTVGQRSVLRAIEMRWSHGSAPGARGRIVASLYDRGLIRTGSHGQGGPRFADLSRWSLTTAGRSALDQKERQS